HCIVAENVSIGENAIVGAMPTESENGVATIGSGVTIGENAVVGPNAMVRDNVEGGEVQ
ncbi:MAG: glucose-1-phosphate adenylyltransferase, partial [Lachnospiraceae bacterium]|nr:glucose-1-phosphate adenylyltransferase [Lachnospiraceae bacterium]